MEVPHGREQRLELASNQQTNVRDPAVAMPPLLGGPHAERQGSQSPDSDIPLDPVARAKATNRRAQKRWRARQKEAVSGYKQTIEELTKKMGQLSKEKAQLETRLARSGNVVHPSTDLAKPTAALAKPASMPDKLAAMLPPLLTFLKLLGVRTGLPTSIDLDYLRGSGPGGQQFHKLYLQELAQCMSEGGDIVGSPAHRRLVEIIDGKAVLFREWKKVDASLYRLIEVGLRRERCPRDLWPRVLAVMALSAEQKLRLMDVQNWLLDEMRGIMTQRERALVVLQSASPSLAEDRSSAASFVHSHLASEELAASLAAENRVRQQFLTDVHEHGLITHVQRARATLTAAPWMVDVLALCNILAEEAGETPAAGAHAHELLTPGHGVPQHLHSHYLEAPMPPLPQHQDTPFVPEAPMPALSHLSSDLDLDLDDPLLADDSTGDSAWMEALSKIQPARP